MQKLLKRTLVTTAAVAATVAIGLSYAQSNSGATGGHGEGPAAADSTTSPATGAPASTDSTTATPATTNGMIDSSTSSTPAPADLAPADLAPRADRN